MIRNGTAPMPRSTAGTTWGVLPHAGRSLSLAPRVPRPGVGQHAGGASPGPAACPSLESLYGLSVGLPCCITCAGRRLLTQARAEAAIIMATDHGFRGTSRAGDAPAGLGAGRDWAREGEGIAQSYQSLAAYQATEVTRDRSDGLALLGETFAQEGADHRGIGGTGRGLATVAKNRVRWWEAELYRLRANCCCSRRSHTAGGGRSLLPAGPCCGPPRAGQVVGAACGDEPEPTVAAAGQAG